VSSLRLAPLLCALLLTACRDEGAERIARARATWDTLVDKGERPESTAFDPVLAELDAVPAGSRHGDEARHLADTIRRARAAPVRAPLALRPLPGRRPPELEAQLAVCARLAQLAGQDGGLDPRTLAAVEACRLRAEKLELRLSHPDDDPAH
jgi:hypothetical protein